MSTVVVGVGGGVAAFKIGFLVRALTKEGHRVHVIPTEASLNFVGVSTWEALSGSPVHTGVFEAGGADHVEIARHADLLVVAPATADLIARLRMGMANDLLTATALASSAPRVIVPAMHTAMWDNPATQDNVQTLRERGAIILGPTTGDLSSGDYGRGRMVEPQEIAREVLSLLRTLPACRPDHEAPAASSRPLADHQPDSLVGSSLAGVRVLVTAGGTHEPIDPVRFVGNHSTGAQGIAIAIAAHGQGADVTLVGANIDPARRASLPAAVNYVAADSASDMHGAVCDRLGTTDVLVMAAAVADYRPSRVSDTKLKKQPTDTELTIHMVRNPDILAEAASSPQRPRVVIGFAAETGSDEEILAHARTKAARKNADLLVVNRVGNGHGFGDVPNTIDILTAHGQVIDHASGTKADVARVIVSHISHLIDGEPTPCAFSPQNL